MTLDEFQKTVETIEDRDQALELFKQLSYSDQCAHRLSPLRERGDSAVWGDFVPKGDSGSGRYTFGSYRLSGRHWLSKGAVRDNTSGQILLSFYRNYDSLWHFFVENHPSNGHDYLISGEDYQGHTVFNLTTGEKKTFIPTQAYLGYGWCPTGVGLFAQMGPKLYLRAVGCYWACPFQMHLWDFSDPDAVEPSQGIPCLTEQAWIDEGDLNTMVLGPDDTLTWEERIRVYTETGETEAEVEFKLSQMLRTQLRKGAATFKSTPEWEALHDSYFTEDADGNDDWSAWHTEVYQATVFSPDEQGRYSDDRSVKTLSDRATRDKERHDKADAERRAQHKDLTSKDPLYQYVVQAYPDVKMYASYTSIAARDQGDPNPFSTELHLGKLGSRIRLSWGVLEGDITVGGSEEALFERGVQAGSYPRTVETLQGLLETILAE
tara:strand:+ start:1157 stop:2461 length:1305 start_codon:yes stop_codon:yes gene_type:complete